MHERIIVSRHRGAIEFIRRELPGWRDVPAVIKAFPDDLRGKVVAGNLPLRLAAFAEMVISIEFRGFAPRKGEFTIADMDQAGAYLAYYRVLRVKGEQ